MTKIYIIVGSCGEYSDYQVWNVRAYASSQEANTATKKLSTLMRRLKKFNSEWHIANYPKGKNYTHPDHKAYTRLYSALFNRIYGIIRKHDSYGLLAEYQVQELELL